MEDMGIMYVMDEDGKEIEMRILFTFENEDTGTQYVVFQEAGMDSEDVYASAYDDDGNLLPIESDEEWDMIQEVLNAFADDGE